VKITKDDIGRKVRLKNGIEAEITHWESETSAAWSDTPDEQSWWGYSCGATNLRNVRDYDVVEFIDERKEVTMSDRAKTLREKVEALARAANFCEAGRQGVLDLVAELSGEDLSKRDVLIMEGQVWANESKAYALVGTRHVVFWNGSTQTHQEFAEHVTEYTDWECLGRNLETSSLKEKL